MSDKKSKKLRQYYNREVKGTLLLLQRVMRPRPRLVPKFLWRALIGLVLKV